MNILQIGLSSYPGGVENAILNYYRFMDKGKVQFDFVCTEETLAYSEEIERAGGKIFYLPSPKRNMLRYRKALRKVINEGKYETVHVNMLSAINLFPAVFAKGTCAKRIIAHAHNANLPGRVKRAAHRLLKCWVRVFANEYLACSKEAAIWLFGKKGAEKTRIVKNAIDYNKYRYSEEVRQEMRARYGIPETGKVIGHVGRFGEEKNQKFLVDRFARVLKLRPETYLMLIGDGGLQQTVKQQVEDLHIADRVIFVSGVNNTAPFYQMMDIFCLPSLFEGLGIAAIEAQIAGLPCICSTGVPQATVITQKAKRVGLKNGDSWVSVILAMLEQNRAPAEETEIAGIGYSAADEAVKLQEYYLKGTVYETSQSANYQS